MTVTPFLSSPKQLARPVFGSSFVLGRAFRFFAVRDQKEGERVQASGLLFGLLQARLTAGHPYVTAVYHTKGSLCPPVPNLSKYKKT